MTDIFKVRRETGAAENIMRRESVRRHKFHAILIKITLRNLLLVTLRNM